MEEVIQFLQKAGVFYLATIDGDQARVRPMGFVMEYKGKLYMATNNTKEMYKQMKAKPKVEICAFAEGKTLRAFGPVGFDESKEAQTKALEVSPQLGQMYKVGDGIFTLYYFESATAVISDFAGGKKEIKL
jgi:uncharacterized pyridoxamine 5'-phosphate oxidase family protein